MPLDPQVPHVHPLTSGEFAALRAPAHSESIGPACGRATGNPGREHTNNSSGLHACNLAHQVACHLAGTRVAEIVICQDTTWYVCWPHFLKHHPLRYKVAAVRGGITGISVVHTALLGLKGRQWPTTGMESPKFWHGPK
jgi:hypothetical protein